MRLLKRLFAGPDTAAKLVQAGIDGIDAAVWTKEEKAGWVVKYMEATQAQNLARRLIACMVFAVFLFLLIVATVAWPLIPEYSEFIIDKIISFHLSALVGGIGIFYFGTHLIKAGKK